MCIVVDTNAFKKVFNPQNEEHDNFRPVFEWILHGKGKLIMGGARYKEEVLTNMSSNIQLVRELGRLRKICSLEDEKVDAKMDELKTKIRHRNFDDPHVLAMCIVSRCRVVCSEDKRSFEFLTDRKLYPKKQKRPSIYSGKHNADLLTNDALLPCSRL